MRAALVQVPAPDRGPRQPAATGHHPEWVRLALEDLRTRRDPVAIQQCLEFLSAQVVQSR